MKTQMKIIYLFLISFTFEKIVIESAYSPECDLVHSLTTFSIEGYSTIELYGIYSFNFSIIGKKEGENYNYNVNCFIPTNSTEPETPDSISDYPTETTIISSEPSETITSSVPSETITTSEPIITSEPSEPPETDPTELPSQYSIRLLQNSNNFPFNGYCKIENLDKNITFKESSFIKSEDINIDASVNLTFIECYQEEEHIESKLVISFRQLNEFLYKNGKITFLFYGMISKNLLKGYLIEMEVKLIENGYKKENTRIANCFLNKNITVNNNIPVQGDFSCVINNVEGNINSFEYYSSIYITGVPKNEILLNPEATKKYISYGEIIDYSVEENEKRIIPIFYTELINNADCKENGKFKIEGKLNVDLKDDFNFEFPLANPRKLVVTCSIKNGKANKKNEIICETNGKINNEKIMIAQTTIYNNKKEEVLIINKFEDKKTSNCKNGIVNTITTKIDIPIPITFRQVNQFISLKNKATFHFIGIVNQFMPYGRKMKMLVFVYIDEKTEQKEANCILNTYTPFNSFDKNYGQVDFYCEVDTKNKPSNLVIISSDDVLGINDDLEEYQKSPIKTDIKIKETEKETNLVKVLDYSSNEILYDIPPVLNILNIYTDNCSNKGKIKIEANFNKKIPQKFDFTIPISYPASTIKCTAPVINANIKVNLDCKVQNDFNINEESIIIEPRIIKKINQEVIYVNKYIQYMKKETCKNYNIIQQNIEQKSNYTFLQTNSFNLDKGKIFFKIFVYPIHRFIQKIELKPIFITIIVKKKSKLRYLEESPEEENITCNFEQNNNTIGEYNCKSEIINVDNENEIESFQIESDDITGLHEENSNPIETDNNIKNNKTINFTEIPDLSIIPTFYPKIDIDNDILTKSCKNNGTFLINGTMSHKPIHNISNFEIHLSEPIDSSCICNFNGNFDEMECLNKEEFVEKEIKFKNQSISGIFFLNETKNKDSYYFTCTISPLANSLKMEINPIIKENDEEGNITQSSIENAYFSKKLKSSGGLSGGTIAAIVICSAIILIAVGILITLIKKGVLIPPKSTYPTSYGSTVPEISNSSVDII